MAIFGRNTIGELLLTLRQQTRNHHLLCVRGRVTSHDAFTHGEAVRSISDQKELGIMFEATSFLMPDSECKIRIVMINFGGLQNETLKRHRRATSEKSSLAHPSGRRKEREGVD